MPYGTEMEVLSGTYGIDSIVTFLDDVRDIENSLKSLNDLQMKDLALKSH